MEKKVFWIIAIAILILALLYFFSPTCNFNRVGSHYPADDGCNSCQCTFLGSVCTKIACNGNNNVNPVFKEGDVLDSLGNKIGTCNHTLTQLGIGTTTRTLFYNINGEYIGECHTYNGPGASGGAGTGCTGNISMETGWNGGTWTNYSCSVW